MVPPAKIGRGTAERVLLPEAVLNAILEVSIDAIVTCDTAGTVTTWNPTAERLFGRTADEVVGNAFEMLFPEHLRRGVKRAISEVLAGDRISRFETEVQRADGMPVPVSLSWCPVVDADDVLVASVVIARDITEQRVAQATLADVEARLDESEGLAHVGSWLWDLRTGAVQWSAEFHRIHNLDPLEFRGTLEAHLEVVHVDDRPSIRAAMEQSVVSGRPFEREYRVVFPDQLVRVVRIRAQPTMGSAGRPVGLHGIGKDVTDELGGAVRAVKS